MKRLVIVLVLITQVFIAKSQDEKVEIKKVLDWQIVAWNEGDVDKFMQGYWESDSLMFIGKSGVTYGWQPTLDNYKKKYSSKELMGKLSFKIIQIDVLTSKDATVIGKWQIDRANEQIGGHFMLKWKLIKGKWVIIADHTS